MLGKFSVAALVLLVPLAGNASEIKQRPFSFAYEVAQAQECDAFVVCSGCPDDHLSALPASPKLAVRLSMSEPRPLQIPAKETETKHKSSLEKGVVSCLLDTVHFPFDSAEISRKERAKLDRLMLGIPVDTVVNLDGFTCDRGSFSHNTNLSLRRAREVASYLKGKGVSVRRVEGLGQSSPVSDDRRLNRRVEIGTQQKEEKRECQSTRN